MKANSQITIWILAAILIFWISFLFIEQQNQSNTTQIGNKNTTIETLEPSLDNEIQKIKEETKKQQKLKEKIKQEALEKKLEEEAQKIAKQNKLEKINQDFKKNISTEITKPIIIPNEYNIQNMDFFSQAPYGNRNQPYQDACEEASLLIWYYYLKNLNKTKAQYNTDLLAMVELEMQMLWYFESTTIMEMKQIINKRDREIKASIIEHPTIRDIEREISQNNVVIAPFYGKWLKNPHYALWGPEYHFMVIKGYNQTNFITHDVWTLRWENREYTKSTIMNNIHDRNRTDVRMWAARILILKK